MLKGIFFYSALMKKVKWSFTGQPKLCYLPILQYPGQVAPPDLILDKVWLFGLLKPRDMISFSLDKVNLSCQTLYAY